MPKISSKNQVTLPVAELARAGLARGEDVIVRADGPHRLVIESVEAVLERHLGVFDGLYPPGYLDGLRAGERA